MSITTENSTCILQYLVDSSTISIDEVLNDIKFMTNKKILNQHKYAITQLKDGRYSTYLPDEFKPYNRKKCTKATLELLEQEIIKYYNTMESQNSINSICLRTFYNDWLEYKSLHTKSSAYIKTIDELWKKYYVNDSIIDIPFKELQKVTLDIWAHTLVNQHQMTKKQYYNMSIIMRQSLTYAVEKGIIEKNPYEQVKIESKLFTTVKKKPDATQVYLIEEQPKIEEEAYYDFYSTGSVACLAIPLAFQLGVRLSELVALKWSDINEEKDNCIHIQRMEVKDYKRLSNNSWCIPKRIVKECTKSYASNRNVYLTTKARDILKLIMSSNNENNYYDNGFIFLNSKGRITSSSLDCRLRKYCRHIGISEKGMHKIRKTYISTLIDSENININYIREQVGHEDERTTYGNYCFNRKSKDRTEQDMELALVQKN